MGDTTELPSLGVLTSHDPLLSDVFFFFGELRRTADKKEETGGGDEDCWSIFFGKI